jgi:hypothetical protein
MMPVLDFNMLLWRRSQVPVVVTQLLSTQSERNCPAVFLYIRAGIRVIRTMSWQSFHQRHEKRFTTYDLIHTTSCHFLNDVQTCESFKHHFRCWSWLFLTVSFLFTQIFGNRISMKNVFDVKLDSSALGLPCWNMTFQDPFLLVPLVFWYTLTSFFFVHDIQGRIQVIQFSSQLN